MRGKSIIELKNVKTGKVRKYENSNLVTNAVSERLSAWMAFYPREIMQVKALPLYNEMFGGILLYESPLEENADNIDLPDPSVSKLIGHAGNIATNGDNTMRGSRNVIESGFINDGKGYKYVYDFGTSEANGTISCLSLTHEIMGYYGNFISWSNLRNEKNTEFPTTLYDYGYENSSAMYSMYENITNKYLNGLVDIEKFKNGSGVYYILTYVKFKNANTILVEKKKLSTSAVYLRNNLTALETISSVEIPITITIYSSTYWNFFNTWTADANYYYAFYNEDLRLYWIKVDRETHEVTQGIKTIGHYIESIYNQYTNNIVSYQNYAGGLVRNGCAYFHIKNYTGETHPYNILKIDFNNNSESVIETGYKYYGSNNNNKNGAVMYKLPNGTIAVNGYLIDLDDNVIPAENFHGGTINDRGKSTTYSDQYATSFKFLGDYAAIYNCYHNKLEEKIFPNICYLGTINNLSEPIVKTDQETMKITYILEETT